QQVKDRLRHIVRVDRATGYADDRDPGLGLPVPAQVVRHTHGTGRVARHGVDAAVAGAGAGAEHDRRLRCQPVDPLVDGDRLVGVRVPSESGEVTLAVDCLVRDGAFKDEYERFQLAPVSLPEPFDEVVGTLFGAAFEID